MSRDQDAPVPRFREASSRLLTSKQGVALMWVLLAAVPTGMYVGTTALLQIHRINKLQQELKEQEKALERLQETIESIQKEQTALRTQFDLKQE
jgi:ABC-type bacteriocin/lantibiotic exporter with double-glycine peptidase domain